MPWHLQTKRRASSALFPLLLCVATASCTAFSAQPNQFKCSVRTNTLLFASGDNDDGGGDDLARQFSEELKRRTAESGSFEPLSESQSDSSREIYELSNNASPPKPMRKFTGVSSPLFTSSNTNDPQMSNIQREKQREFNLASRFESTFPIQAAILVASAIFILSVGLTGGITDGSDRSFYGDDDLIEDTVVEYLERIRTDDAAQVSGSRELQAVIMKADQT
jgi:hypothetical protein